MGVVVAELGWGWQWESSGCPVCAFALMGSAPTLPDTPIQTASHPCHHWVCTWLQMAVRSSRFWVSELPTPPAPCEPQTLLLGGEIPAEPSLLR